MTIYRVLVDGERPFRAQGYPYKRQDMRSVRQDYTHAVVGRDVADHTDARVLCYSSRLDLAEKKARQARNRHRRLQRRQGAANPMLHVPNREFFVVPLARKSGTTWSAAAPGGLEGYRSREDPNQEGA